MAGNKGGIAFAVIVVLAVTASVGFVLSPQPTSVITQVIPANPAFTNTTTLYANAEGWDTPTSYGNANGAIPVNPTLNYTVGTLITFNVIETDTLPHDLYIAKGTSEDMSAYYSVIGAINPVPGSQYSGVWYAATAGVYTYWCQVHPTTMVGTINVVASTNSSAVSTSSPISQITSLTSPHINLAGTDVVQPLIQHISHENNPFADKMNHVAETVSVLSLLSSPLSQIAIGLKY